MRSTLVGAMIVLALGAAPASAAVRYAEPGGDGPAGTCPKSNPCDIEDATEDASVDEGDEVVVLPGTYDLGSGNIELSDVINLHGALGGPKPVITSTAGNGTTLDGGALHVHDLIFRSFDDNPVYGALGVAGPATVERVVAISEDAPGCNGAPLAPGVMRDTVCATENGPAGIMVIEPGGTFRLRNVTALGLGSGSHGIRFEVANGALSVFAHNVIGRGGGAVADVAAATVTSGAITINLAHSNYMSRETSGPGAETITPPTDADNQTDPPELADPDDGDFKQLPGSPTIDAGGDIDLLGELDFDRQPRIQGAAIDIGADEFDDRLKLKAKARRHQKATKLKVKVSCPEEECYVKASGRAEAGGERFKLKRTKQRFLAAGQKRKLKLKPKNAGELKKLLANGEGKARITVKGTDAGGVKAKKKLKVGLVG